jgi:hypothetical protein
VFRTERGLYLPVVSIVALGAFVADEAFGDAVVKAYLRARVRVAARDRPCDVAASEPETGEKRAWGSCGTNGSSWCENTVPFAATPFRTDYFYTCKRSAYNLRVLSDKMSGPRTRFLISPPQNLLSTSAQSRRVEMSSRMQSTCFLGILIFDTDM